MTPLSRQKDMDRTEYDQAQITKFYPKMNLQLPNYDKKVKKRMKNIFHKDNQIPRSSA